MIRRRAISVLAAVIALALVPAFARAERVAYKFEGMLATFDGGEATLFNVPHIPNGAAITGIFAFETTIAGVGDAPAVYAQSIDAGFKLNIGNMLQLSATDFAVRVSNDFERLTPVGTVETVDTFSVRFDSGSVPAPKPLNVNDVPWTGTAQNKILLYLTFPSDTFADTTLPSPLPDSFSQEPNSTLGYNSLPPTLQLQQFAITSVTRIVPQVGDYNIDGAVGLTDYAEWRRTFGCSGSACGPADGNHDGTVDAGDYVVWRRAAAGAGSLNTSGLPLPEPSALVLWFLSWIGCASVRRHAPRSLRGP